MHVWLARMPEGWQPGPDALSAEEHLRARKFVFPHHRERYEFHHAALRVVLAGYTGLAPREVPFAAAGQGKPVLAAPHGRWRFNLSHSGPVSLCAVAEEREVGVDIERVRPMPDAERIAARFFASSEREALAVLEGPRRDEAFFACWTRKEAVVKAGGEGLLRDLQAFAVPVDPEERGPVPADGRWTLLPLPPVAGHRAALAVEGDALPVLAWEFQAP